MRSLGRLGFVVQIAAVVGLIYLAGGTSPAAPQAQGRGAVAVDAAQNGQFVPGEVLVQFRVDADDAAKQRAHGRVTAEVQELIIAASDRVDGKGDLELARIPAGISVAAAVRGLRADPSVEFAEPNWVYTHAAVSNDLRSPEGR